MGSLQPLSVNWGRAKKAACDATPVTGSRTGGGHLGFLCTPSHFAEESPKMNLASGNSLSESICKRRFQFFFFWMEFLNNQSPVFLAPRKCFQPKSNFAANFPFTTGVGVD